LLKIGRVRFISTRSRPLHNPGGYRIGNFKNGVSVKRRVPDGLIEEEQARADRGGGSRIPDPNNGLKRRYQKDCGRASATRGVCHPVEPMHSRENKMSLTVEPRKVDFRSHSIKRLRIMNVLRVRKRTANVFELEEPYSKVSSRGNLYRVCCIAPHSLVGDERYQAAKFQRIDRGEEGKPGRQC